MGRNTSNDKPEKLDIEPVVEVNARHHRVTLLDAFAPLGSSLLHSAAVYNHAHVASYLLTLDAVFNGGAMAAHLDEVGDTALDIALDSQCDAWRGEKALETAIVGQRSWKERAAAADDAMGIGHRWDDSTDKHGFKHRHVDKAAQMSAVHHDPHSRSRAFGALLEMFEARRAGAIYERVPAMARYRATLLTNGGHDLLPLRAITASADRLTDLDLSGVKLGDEGAVVLAMMLDMTAVDGAAPELGADAAGRAKAAGMSAAEAARAATADAAKKAKEAADAAAAAKTDKTSGRGARAMFGGVKSAATQAAAEADAAAAAAARAEEEEEEVGVDTATAQCAAVGTGRGLHRLQLVGCDIGARGKRALGEALLHSLDASDAPAQSGGQPWRPKWKQAGQKASASSFERGLPPRSRRPLNAFAIDEWSLAAGQAELDVSGLGAAFSLEDGILLAGVLASNDSLTLLNLSGTCMHQQGATPAMGGAGSDDPRQMAVAAAMVQDAGDAEKGLSSKARLRASQARQRAVAHAEVAAREQRAHDLMFVHKSKANAAAEQEDRGQEAFVCLLAALRGHIGLTDLRLAGAGVALGACYALGSLLRSRGCGVTSLDLSRNGLRPKAVAVLGDALHRGVAAQLGARRGGRAGVDPALSFLDLSLNKLVVKDDGAKTTSRGRARGKAALDELAAGALSVARLLEKSTTLRRVGLRGVGLGGHNDKRVLARTGGALGVPPALVAEMESAEADAVAAAYEVRQQAKARREAKALKLIERAQKKGGRAGGRKGGRSRSGGGGSRNGSGSRSSSSSSSSSSESSESSEEEGLAAGAAADGAMARHASHLAVPALSRLSSLDLRHNGLVATDATNLARGLSTALCLKTLLLAHNRIGMGVQTGVLALAAALGRPHCGITALDMSDTVLCGVVYLGAGA